MKTVLTSITADIDNIASKRADLRIPDSMKSDVEDMTGAFGKENSAPLRYLSVLSSSENLLMRVGSKEIKGTVTSQSILDDVAALFATIGGAVRKSATGAISSVNVTIKVMRSGQEMKGWEIFYMEYFLKHVRKEVGPDSFPQTSTASYPLPPGRYLFEASDLRGGMTEQKACTVEGDGPILCELLVK
jgi:hypothetical protein